MMHLVLTAAALLISVLGSTLGARDPYSVMVDYSKYKNGTYSLPSCDFVIKTEPDCIPGSGDNSASLIPGCKAKELVFDMEGCCFVCPKPAQETCGGWLFQHGRCPDNYECLHEVLIKENFYTFMSPKNGTEDCPTGKCIWLKERMALWKNCCSRSKKKMECGSDGNWYPNKCFLYKANGFRKPGAPEIKVIKKNKNSVCKTPPNEDDMCKERSIAACNMVFSVYDKERPKLYYSKDDKQTCGVTRTPTSVSNTAPESVSPSILPQPLQ